MAPVGRGLGTGQHPDQDSQQSGNTLTPGGYTLHLTPGEYTLHLTPGDYTLHLGSHVSIKLLAPVNIFDQARINFKKSKTSKSL